MNWEHLLALPATAILLGAAVLALLALVAAASGWRHWRARRRVRGSLAALLALAWLLLALLSAGLGLSLCGYRRLASEVPVVTVDARILSPQRWALTLTWPDGSTRQAALAGDAFRVEAIVLKWKLPTLLAGVPPLYRLDRLDGRYDDPAQESDAPRTVIDFRQAGAWDLLALRQRYPRWLPSVDTVYGSGAFLPLVDQGHYTVSLMRTGALVARPDDATARRLDEALR
ncbi:hypothetical protein ACO2Q2_12145 [Dyella sp. KRB-257]|uniref:hypothetical protein n=1 Tax=Dyella sp. KRB-257 TaxID=3400915 RepID=UPI003C0FD08F